ncbi:hypothetical protein KIPB_011202 [Kipferlia bialata]|uniref:Uncharacterized protein n=1 Tax=Kipferlia bialata TaxID=797122 RepID=A0A9K3GM45_9EUKA|nr:hypothetical protein KIPB_011202 [Kipferlia bialata]|eukprot:g11202.t1
MTKTVAISAAKLYRDNRVLSETLRDELKYSAMLRLEGQQLKKENYIMRKRVQAAFIERCKLIHALAEKTGLSASAIESTMAHKMHMQSGLMTMARAVRGNVARTED